MLSVLLILPDFLIILLGYLLKQGKLGQHFNEGFWKGAENIVFYVLFPPLLFTSVANSKLSLADAGYFLAVAVGTMFLAVLLSWLVRKIVPADDVTHASVFHCGFRFNSYVGFAIIMRLAGEEGFAFFAFLMAFWVPISSSIAVSALAGAVARAENVQKKGGLWKKTVKTIFTNPLIIATVSGLLVNVFAVPIPEVLMHFLKSFARDGTSLHRRGSQDRESARAFSAHRCLDRGATRRGPARRPGNGLVFPTRTLGRGGASGFCGPAHGSVLLRHDGEHAGERSDRRGSHDGPHARRHGDAPRLGGRDTKRFSCGLTRHGAVE